MNRVLSTSVLVLAGLALLSTARADEIVFRNGDRLTGKIETYDGDKLTISGTPAGKVTVSLKDVRTFSTTGEIDVVTADGSVLHRRVLAGPAGQIGLAPGAGVAAQEIPIASIKKINPPPVRWTGNVVLGGTLTRGNTNTDNFNASAHVERKSDQDRITVDAAYLYGREHVVGAGTHETENDWFVEGKYDYFLNPRLYAYADARAERDVIANLSLRLTPGVGAGYQWFDTPKFKFNTEGGASWLYRDYSNDGTQDSVSLRLAYHLTAKPNDKVTIFHDMEYFPGLDELPDYFFDTDAGIRTTLTDKMFAEFKIDYRYDSRPAPGRGPNDVRYILGVGVNF